MGEFGNEGLQRLLPEGHRIVFGEVFPFFATHLPPPFERCFFTHCPVHPTTFIIRAVFQRGVAGIDCTIWIKRLDDRDIQVEAGFWVKATSTSLGIRVPREGGWSSMSGGDEKIGIHLAFIPDDILTRLGDADLQFQAVVVVQGCHSVGDTAVASRVRDIPPPHKKQRLSANI